MIYGPYYARKPITDDAEKPITDDETRCYAGEPIVPDPMGKPTNPKDAAGVLKFPMSYLPAQVLAEVAVGMVEGGHKYGKGNYRDVGVRASIYYDATLRHMMQWWEGEDIDMDSGLSHVTKAIASLVVLRDSMMNQNFTDDRPIQVTNPHWYEALNQRTEDLDAKYPTKRASFTELDNTDSTGFHD